jgi:hypothetical protein
MKQVSMTFEILKSSLKNSLAALFVIFNLTNTQAQNQIQLNVGADLVSRYVWRGTDFGNSPAIQPELSLSYGNFSLGAWGSYSSNTDAGADEGDLFATYSFKSGTDIIITDYFFPGDGMDYFYAKNHFLEAGITQAISKFYVSVNFMFANANDDVYLETGYSTDNISLFIGAGNEAYTPDGQFSVCNLGVTISKEIPLSTEFSLPIWGSLIFNPAAEGIHMVFGLSL